jgi:GxxExxY protein
MRGGSMNAQFSELSNQVIGCAIAVHREVGPGLLESVYRRCLSREFELRSIPFTKEAAVPLTYKGLTFDWCYRADFLVEGRLLVELKTVEKLLPVHRAQVLTYLRLLRAEEALLFNFHTARLADGGIACLVP